MLYYNTVNQTLKSILDFLMKADEFKDFCLVGGTALSLQLGHRVSIDIDLFTDVTYGSIDFQKIDDFLEQNFSFTEHLSILPALGKSYRIGNSKTDFIKLDVFYTDNFISKKVEKDSIRMANLKDIIAMKLEVIQNKGRKKDFWDLHKLLEKHNLSEMIDLHQKRYPYNHNRKLIINNLTDFSLAEQEPTPECLEGKYWEIIKMDFEEEVERLQQKNKRGFRR